MTQGVLDLIKAIDSGDSLAIDAAFNTEMATRISSRLDDMRGTVAQNMFKEEQTEEVETEVEEELELSDEQVDGILESITEEDLAEIDAITEEQIEEAAYCAKEGEDMGKPGKNFAKIADKAAAKYGSAERGRKVAGAVLAKLRKNESIGDAVQKGVDVVKKLAGLATGTVGMATGALQGAVTGARKGYHSVAD